MERTLEFLQASQALQTLAGSRLVVDSWTAEARQLALRVPMDLPFGRIQARPSGWVHMRGIVDGISTDGYGEGATLPEPLFTNDSGHNIATNMTLLAAHAQTAGASMAEAVAANQLYRFKDEGRYPTARLAVEMALLDMYCNSKEISVASLIGLPEHITGVPYGFSIGASDPGLLMKQAESAIAADAKKVKVKISPATHAGTTEAIRSLQVAYPGVEFMVDANGTYDPTRQDDLAMIRELDGLGLITIEEPVSRAGAVKHLDAVRLLRQKQPVFETRLCLDDCLTSLDDCTDAFEEGLAEIINVKPGRIGSFLTALALVDWVQAQGGEVMVGGMLEATPGRRMTTLLGAYCLHKGFHIPGDLSLAQERLAEDLVPVEEQMKMTKQGAIVLPTGKGWGI